MCFNIVTHPSRKIYSVAASAPIGGTEVYTVSKVFWSHCITAFIVLTLGSRSTLKTAGPPVQAANISHLWVHVPF